MIQSRTAQLIFQTAYCTLGFVGIIASFGIFDNIEMLRWDFYVRFTNLSSYLCIGVMLAELIQTAKRKQDGYVTTAPTLKFIGMLAILLTFLVFNLLLAGEEGRDPQLNWRVGNLCFHVVLPIMYILDWILFYKKGKVKAHYPIASMAFPLAYAALLLIQAVILNFDSSILMPGTDTPLIYPYFFINLETQGVLGVLKWVVIFTAAFVAVGYAFLGLDKLLAKKERTKR